MTKDNAKTTLIDGMVTNTGMAIQPARKGELSEARIGSGYGRFLRAARIGALALGAFASTNLIGTAGAQVWSEKPPLSPRAKEAFFPAIRSKLPELTDRGSEFERIVTQSDKLVVVVVWGDKSATSKDSLQIADRVSDRYSGRVSFARMNYDRMSKVPSLDNYFGASVTGVPTTLFIYKGKILEATSGLMVEAVLLRWLDENMERAGCVSGQ